MQILETRSEVKVTVTRKQNGTIRNSKMHSHTKLPSKMHLHTKFWNSYLIEYRRYAPDSNQFLETRSEVNVNVTGTQGWCATLFYPKMHPHTKFRIPTSNNIGDMLRKQTF